MPRLVAVYEHAAATHELAAALHDHVETFFTERGDLAAADRERKQALKDRRGALEDHERARLRRELLHLPASDP